LTPEVKGLGKIGGIGSPDGPDDVFCSFSAPELEGLMLFIFIKMETIVKI
jgi:hypothetical protein